MTSAGDTPLARALMIEELIGVRKYDTARRLLAEALTIWPDDSDLLATGAYLDLKVGHYPGAMWYADNALRTDPGNGQAQRIRISVLVRGWNKTPAIEAAWRLVQTHPNQASSHYMLAVALYAARRKNAALGAIDEALRIAPDDSSYRNLRGQIIGMRSWKGKALKEFRLALRADPDNAHAMENVGMAQSRRWRLSSSLRAYLDLAGMDIRRADDVRAGVSEVFNRLVSVMNPLNFLALVVLGASAAVATRYGNQQLPIPARVIGGLLAAAVIALPVWLVLTVPRRSGRALSASLRRSKLIGFCVVLSGASALCLMVVVLVGSVAIAESALSFVALPVMIVFALRLVASASG
ncbi:tetratricopeptide repeat protein [Mycobacterium sp. NPDC050853]|uniref:tetratricopeptide repeat protein n=1 Tax=Mycobacterium sp. NPDC050853 TaxID=3155160 RepID=UPI00340DE748